MNAKFNEREESFIREMLIDGIAAKAARRAGYSATTAASQGSRLMARPEIRKAVMDGFTERHMSVEEATKRITDTARTRLNDYLIVNSVVKSRMVRKPLRKLIQELELEGEIEADYYHESDRFRSTSTGGEGDDADAEADATALQNLYHAQKREREEKILRYEIELRHNAKAYRDVPETQEVREVTVDLDAIRKEKERGTIKKLSFNEKGLPSIEMYPADNAQEIVLKLHGKLVNKHDHGLDGFSFLDFLMETDTVDDNDDDETDDDGDDE